MVFGFCHSVAAHVWDNIFSWSEHTCGSTANQGGMDVNGHHWTSNLDKIEVPINDVSTPPQGPSTHSSNTDTDRPCATGGYRHNIEYYR